MIDDDQDIGWTTNADRAAARSPPRTPGTPTTNPDGLAPFFVLPGDGTRRVGRPDGLALRAARDRPRAGLPRDRERRSGRRDVRRRSAEPARWSTAGRSTPASPTPPACARADRRADQGAGTTGARSTTWRGSSTTRTPTSATKLDAVDPRRARRRSTIRPARRPTSAPYVARAVARRQARGSTTARTAARRLDVRDAGRGSTPANDRLGGDRAVQRVDALLPRATTLDDEYDAPSASTSWPPRRQPARAHRLRACSRSPATFVQSATTGQPIICDRYATTGADDSCTKMILIAMVDAMNHLESAAGLRHAPTRRVAVGQAPPLTITPLFPNTALNLRPGGFPKAGDNFVVNRADQGWDDLDFSQYADGPAQRFLAEAAAGRADQGEVGAPRRRDLRQPQPALPRPARQLLPAADALRRAATRCRRSSQQASRGGSFTADENPVMIPPIGNRRAQHQAPLRVLAAARDDLQA